MRPRHLFIVAFGLASLFTLPVLAVDVVLFGPEVFTRTAGAPNDFAAAFSGFPDDGPIGTITVLNGDAAGTHRISSAIVSVNGVLLLGPQDFNQQVYEISRTFNLLESNTVEIQLRGKPGGHLSLGVTQAVDAGLGVVIGVEGGHYQVTDPSSPFRGFGIEVPAGAVEVETLFTMAMASFPATPLPGDFTPVDDPISIEATSTLVAPIYMSVPWEEPREEGEVRVLLVHNTQDDSWEFVEPVPGRDSTEMVTRLPHLSVYVKARAIWSFSGISTGFTVPDDAHVFENVAPLPSCRCENGDYRDGGICAGMSLLALEYFVNYTQTYNEGLACHWSEDTDFDASCEAHCRFNSEINDFGDRILSYFNLVSAPSMFDETFVLDYVKAMSAFNLPVSLALIGGSLDPIDLAFHNVLAIGWEKTGLFSGEITIYDNIDNSRPWALSYLEGPGPLTFFSYDRGDYVFFWAGITSRLALGLGDLIEDNPKNGSCDAGGCGYDTGPCYIDNSCSGGVRRHDTNECVPYGEATDYIEYCTEIWKCANGPVTGSCGGGTQDCQLSPGCGSRVQTCFYGGCTSLATCNDRIKNGHSWDPTENQCTCVGNPPAAGGCYNWHSISVDEPAHGNVVDDNFYIFCGVDNSMCERVLAHGWSLTLTAVPCDGYEFVRWEGGADCADGHITLTGDTHCTAVFERD